MTNVELALNTLAEAATTELSKEINPTTYRENVTVARKGGGVAKVAREQLEQQLGRSVISESNSSTLRIPRDSRTVKVYFPHLSHIFGKGRKTPEI